MLLHVLLPLFLGTMIYLLFRTTSLLVFDWLGFVGLLGPLMDFREFMAPVQSSLPEWFLFSLPDGLWVYSWVASMVLVWGRISGFQSGFWILIGPVLGCGSELAQYGMLLPGTFEISDLEFYLLGAFLAYHNLHQKAQATSCTTKHSTPQPLPFCS